MSTEKAEADKVDFKDVENGPMSQDTRECRDVFCCLLFIVNIIAMVYCTYEGYKAGNLSKIFRGTDANQNICGQDLTAGYPYLYFYNPSTFASADFTTRVCVVECPNYSTGTLSILDCYGRSCAYTLTINQDGSMSATMDTSTFLGYETTAQAGRVCVPSAAAISSSLATYATQFSASFQAGGLSQFTTDVVNNWKWLLAGFGMAVGFTFIFMFSLRCFVGLIVWTSLIGVIFVFAALGIIFLANSGQFPAIAAQIGYLGLKATLAPSQYYAYYGYASFGVSGLFLILTLCCCSRIRVAVAVCKVAGQFVMSVFRIILVPIFQSILLLGLWGACLAVMVYLVSAAPFIARSGSIFTEVTSYSDPSLIRLYYFVFGTLWCNATLMAIGTFVVASACCMWYYSHGPGSELDSPVLRSYKMLFRYHFGSIAFGSLILAIVQFLQFLVQIFKKQAQSTGADQNKCFQYVINFLRCCLACVERIVQFINKTAFIQIALRGKNFCMAASDGFQLVWSNAMRYAIVSGVGEIVMFLGKIMIAASSTLCFYCLITYVASIKANILEPLYLLLIVAIMAYAVGSVFMAVYSLAMETILACFIVDELNQKAKGGKGPMHAPPELTALMDD